MLFMDVFVKRRYDAIPPKCPNGRRVEPRTKSRGNRDRSHLFLVALIRNAATLFISFHNCQLWYHTTIPNTHHPLSFRCVSPFRWHVVQSDAHTPNHQVSKNSASLYFRRRNWYNIMSALQRSSLDNERKLELCRWQNRCYRPDD